LGSIQHLVLVKAWPTGHDHMVDGWWANIIQIGF